jgi:hypothetical protein
MEPTEEIRSRLRDLCISQKLAVISTQSGGQPYDSLVAFVAGDNADAKRTGNEPRPIHSAKEKNKS